MGTDTDISAGPAWARGHLAVAALCGLGLGLGCGSDVSVVDFNPELLGRYTVINTNSLNPCDLPEYPREIIDLTEGWFVVLDLRETEIGDYMGFRLCTDEEMCAEKEPSFLYTELRDGRWLAETRAVVQYSDRCVYQHVRSLVTVNANSTNLTFRTVRRAGEQPRPEGTQCNTSTVEDLLEQDVLDCVSSEELNTRKQ